MRDRTTPRDVARPTVPDAEIATVWATEVADADARRCRVPGRAGGPAASPCQSALPRARLDLPAPVIVTTSCGRFHLGPAGRVVYLGPRTLPVPRGASYWADLTWTRFARGHLLVGRGHQQLWRP